MRTKFIALAIALAGVSGPAMAQCVGNCGTGAPNGVVTASPAGAGYNYVSTDGGVAGGASLGLGGETTGSRFTTGSFSANAGAELTFYFNYVTSDGADFADYAYVQLLGASSPTTLFTARTTTSGNTVPGFGLPGLAPGVVLQPASTAIIPGGPLWDKLGDSSGDCFATGCGYTGWIKMTYTILDPGNYSLRFGVTNWADNAFDSGLAWNGAFVDGKAIGGIPEASSWAMLIAGFGLVGAASRRRRATVAA
jgi:hypothetical protein